MSRQPSCQLCHNLIEASSLPISTTPIIDTDLVGLKISRDQGCAFCQLIWDVVNSQSLPDQEIRVVLSKVSADDISLFISWNARSYDPQITVSLYMEQEDKSDPMCRVFGTKSHIIENPCSDEATSLIKQWLKSCNDPAQHEWCAQTDHTVCLPTRVVDVDPSGGSKIPRLVETKGESGAYVALSHCWGKTQIITTTKATLEDRKGGIQWSHLSRTFQDAISLTKNLGIRYIWIDSLCIIQDDGKDWEIESANMGNIYENSYVTLAATAAPDGSNGFHAPRPPPRSFHLRGTRHQIFAALQPPHDSFTRRRHADPRKMPLLSRAWVYQERILSKRVVHFGYHELVFECKNGYICECGGISRYVNPWSFLSSFKTEFADFLDGRKPDDPGDYIWASMIRGYTACALTFDQDRLPALSATAKRLQPKMGEYLAGLWSTMLPAALFWTADAFDFENPAGPMNNAEASWKPARRSSAKSCPPTWSWASVEGAVIEATQVLSPVSKQTFYIKVISTSTSPLYQDPYGAVKDGRIQVVGPVVQVNCKIVTDGPKTTQHPHFRLEKGGFTHDFFQDVGISEKDKRQTVGSGFYCLIGEYFQDAVVHVRGKAEEKRYSREVTLVLRVKEPDSGLFERVGVTSGIPQEWIPLAEERTVILV